MKPHNISIKRNKSFKLTHLKNKFVLFIDENRKLDSGVPLHRDIKDMIKAGIGLNIISALVVSILSIIILNFLFGLQITSIPDWALSGKIN